MEPRIIFIYNEDRSEILLQYTPRESAWVQTWVLDRLSVEQNIELRNTFILPKNYLTHPCVLGETDTFIFKFALLDKNGYYRIPKAILDTKHDVFIHWDIKFEERLFVYSYNIPIFQNIDDICNEEIFIGGVKDGDKSGFIPKDAFETLMKKFPTTHERKLYSQSRISSILKEYMGTMKDAEEKLQNFYTRREKKLLLKTRDKNIIPPNFYQNEIHKYEKIEKSLRKRLDENDNMVEADWQEFIKEFLLLIFPQYIVILEKVKIKDLLSNQYKPTNREIDFVFVNADGYIDILEIKRPDKTCILSDGYYRGNFYPSRVLSGTLMQAEKYLLYLKTNAINIEKTLSEKYKEELPEGLNIKIRNPRAKILLGRSHGFDKAQKLDFEIIKRKYSNIIDIMSYDDVLSYLDNILVCLKNKS